MGGPAGGDASPAVPPPAVAYAWPRILLIAPNAGSRMGGEALKALQYFRWLLEAGADARLITHARNRDELAALFPPERLSFVEDGPLQRLAWQSRLGRPLVTPLFHRAAARLARRHDPARTVLHYICPISPVAPRLAPRGYHVVIGPLSGNIHYPPALARRTPAGRRLGAWLHAPAQRGLGLVFRDRARAERLLVSGGARTRRSLLLAGAPRARMAEVLDAGVAPALLRRARPAHTPPRFACIGRMVDDKGFDLALRGLAQCDAEVELVLHGDGPSRPALEATAARLGLGARVRFAGWLDHARLAAALDDCRGLVMPSLAEANGIVMQEAMALAVPVVALDWGGPAELGRSGGALLVPVAAEAELVAGLAGAMQALARAPERAARLGQEGRDVARARFDWDRVAASWAGHYPRRPAGPKRPGGAGRGRA
ncbi:glycosyltransferase family 4 protein [Limimaricola pyoseonensis]|uniref:Glycosyltransferase involved in cell wall bisynthesis n=1 Tax=Limimaricola pyoseonensis TaxID=521013 RepID=A0A1G7LDC7_9RHOB|nr:glycosyltransferase family 4 protein [Limimaricola pyoseonensis]SDF47537.1 Glycosyltransferase involved in cell wall bisynthesis [Limimaricola pyoseonensis]